MSADTAPITREEAARLLGASERHVRRLIQQGRLPLERDTTTGRRVLRRQAVLDLASEQRGVITQLEAADRLGCGRRTIRRMLDDGRLTPVPTPGGHDRVALDSVTLRLADTTSHADNTGQEADNTGHAMSSAATTGHHATTPAAGDAELIPLLDDSSRAPIRPPTASRPPPLARRRERRAAAIASVLLATALGAFLAPRLLPAGIPSSTRGRVSPPAQVSRRVPAPTPTLKQRTTFPTAAGRTPVARGGRAITLSQPSDLSHRVRRTETHHPAATRTAAAPVVSQAPSVPVSTIVVTSARAASSAGTTTCRAIYGPEGLC